MIYYVDVSKWSTVFGDPSVLQALLANFGIWIIYSLNTATMVENPRGTRLLLPCLTHFFVPSTSNLVFITFIYHEMRKNRYPKSLENTIEIPHRDRPQLLANCDKRVPFQKLPGSQWNGWCSNAGTVWSFGDGWGRGERGEQPPSCTVLVAPFLGRWRLFPPEMSQDLVPSSVRLKDDKILGCATSRCSCAAFDSLSWGPVCALKMVILWSPMAWRNQLINIVQGLQIGTLGPASQLPSFPASSLRTGGTKGLSCDLGGWPRSITCQGLAAKYQGVEPMRGRVQHQGICMAWFRTHWRPKGPRFNGVPNNLFKTCLIMFVSKSEWMSSKPDPCFVASARFPILTDLSLPYSAGLRCSQPPITGTILQGCILWRWSCPWLWRSQPFSLKSSAWVGYVRYHSVILSLF